MVADSAIGSTATSRRPRAAWATNRLAPSMHALARQLRRPSGPGQRPSAGAVDRQRRAVRRRSRAVVSMAANSRRGDSARHGARPARPAAAPASRPRAADRRSAGATCRRASDFQAGPDGGVVAELPGDEDAAGAGDAGGERGGRRRSAGRRARRARRVGGLGRGLGRGVGHRLGVGQSVGRHGRAPAGYRVAPPPRAHVVARAAPACGTV